jgi:glycosyltransferase involved in cell wall biosynthesis
VLVAPSARSALKLRDGLIRDAAGRGHEVVCVAPDAGSEIAGFKALGCKASSFELRRPGLAFFADRRVLSELATLLRELGADAVLGYGGRPAMMAALAARRAKVGRIGTLINVFPDLAPETPPDDALAVGGYVRAAKASDVLIVHNTDFLRHVPGKGLSAGGVAPLVVAGAGVDLEAHAVQSLPALDAGLTFLMIAQLARSRGVLNYVAAARAVKARAPGAKFLLAGPAALGEDAVPLEACGVTDGVVEYLGAVDDVRPLFARTHVFVYPSPREGMPRQVLEAMAAGRPIITTNAPGCRDTVDERVNGCLAAPGDADGLTAAIESFLKRPDLIPAMSRASRLKAERRFDVREVNRTVLDALGL